MAWYGALDEPQLGDLRLERGICVALLVSERHQTAPEVR